MKAGKLKHSTVFHDCTIKVFDKELGVKWPGKNFIISKKDKKLDSFKNFKNKIKFL